MQAIPSLVGTGTVVAAAATGLVIGQSVESNPPTPSRPFSPFTRPLFSDFRFDTPTPSSTRPGTESGLRLSHTVDGPSVSNDPSHPSPLYSNPLGSARHPPTPSRPIASPIPPTSSRRQSYVRSGDVAAANANEGARDSAPSRGSWIRRLSLRPGSQHDSPRSRSSLGPDTSFSRSPGSGPSLLSPTSSNSPSNHANKLIKRVGTNRESLFTRRDSKGQVPTIRRPATSHQRSATVQQVPTTPVFYLPSFEESAERLPRPRASTAGQSRRPGGIEEGSAWTSFFHMRRVRTLRRRNMPASNESSPADNFLPGMRIQLRYGDLPVPYLIHPQLVSGEVFDVAVVDSVLEQTINTDTSVASEQSPQIGGRDSLDKPDDTPTRKARPSFSSQFGSNSGWRARAGSLRRPKRISEDHSANRRYASDPTSSASTNAAQSDCARSGTEELFTPPKSGNRNPRMADVYASEDRPRECRSPIPPLSRLSSFRVDLSRVGPSPPPSAGLQAISPTQLSPTAAPFGSSLPSHSRAVSKEGAVTLAGSEMSVPGLAGDDDTDYKSDALFDSFRTMDTDHFRMAETPIDTMFDESYHGAPGQFKAKRLSIQEILGNSWDGDTRILEEDEGSVTPMRGLREPRIAAGVHGDDRATEIAKFQLSIGDRERAMGRISLDTTDDDYDWAREEEDVLSNPLSPPNSSFNSRIGPSPPLRSALSGLSGNSPSDSYTISPLERPRSNVFDWAEPSHETTDSGLSRPKTARGQQDHEHRGGRVGGRKGFPAVHVRSQSVPVVPDLQDVINGAPKCAPKFGTWAVGNMDTSEDWDDDFDFEEASNAGSGSGSRPAKSLSMRVPQPIQATQSTVKAHSGQIRELSLLVSSLERLYRQGRELQLLEGQAATLWKEAENIIALASPPEDEAESSDSDLSFSDFDPSTIDERFLDEGFDASILDREGSPQGSPNIPKNAVVKERTVHRRRSVFSPDDDVFGNNQNLDSVDSSPHTPRTPDRVREFHTADGAVVSSVIAAMEQQRAKPGRAQDSPLRPSKAKLFFDTNSLQELVKRAATVFHALSDIVRREELLTMSPQSTPRHDRTRRGGSPAFTRVFSDPDAGSPRHLVKSQKSHSPIPRQSLSLDSNGLSQRMQMMTVG